MLSHDNFNEEKLSKMLSEMPKIQDNQDKDKLYEKISNKINGDDQQDAFRTKQKFPWAIPSIASIAVVILLIVIFQDAFPNRQYSNSDSASEQSTSSSDKALENSDMAPFAAEKNDSFDAGKRDESDGMTENEMSMLTKDIGFSSYIIYDSNPNVSIIPVAAMDENIQYVVPLTLVDNTNPDADPANFYNQLDAFINEEELGVVVFPFGKIAFQLELGENKVLLTIPDGYQMEEGSAIGGMFKQVLATMFTPYGITKAVVDPDNSRNESFGMYGNIDSLPLDKPKNQSFKLYRGTKANQALLIPSLPNQFNTMEEALEDMKQNQPDFLLEATIDSDVDLEIKVKAQGVTISSSSSKVANNQETATMIEAILLTAKSFGYTSVTFDFPVEQVGAYQLNKSIQVPAGPNPIQLH
ncbi:hypothetical protein [Aquibacillus salsiterrae]|uniref:GerMN domain-containing protein n=1 Tax=Aquibacillus salsiterrae TaxID=2950439 RepID=A0A9X3WAC4_9BACI|nr:hypothetical protein [Aquibacillus salsiterrae]MDC3415412.1 hypothetical protein [Aquibacillus salsiterrae]